ncbi:MAG: hypothetical protein HY070_02995 [Chloroflexi bacterium]|nr:hypothetical protein [Chloroflexota bacterium]
MSDPISNQLVSDLARDLISQAAPQELPLFRANSEAYFKDSKKFLETRGGKDEMLGFGAGEAITFVTPAALMVTSAVVQFIAAEVLKAAKTESAAILNERVKQLFKKFRPPEKIETKPSVTLTTDQLAQVRKIALEKAKQLELSEEKANLLADSLIGSLAVSS